MARFASNIDHAPQEEEASDYSDNGEDQQTYKRQRLESTDSLKKTTKVKYEDWMGGDSASSEDEDKKAKKKRFKDVDSSSGSSSENEDKEDSSSSSSDSNEKSSDNEEEEDYSKAFDKGQFEGKKGHLLLQLQKSYKGDDRFQLTKSGDFDIDLSNAKKTMKQLPQTMLGALSKREEELLKES